MRRIQYYRKGIFLDYKIKETDFNNSFFDGEQWHIKEFWSVFIQLGDKLFDYDDMYYDGHTSKCVTILWIRFGKNYSYDSRPLKNW